MIADKEILLIGLGLIIGVTLLFYGFLTVVSGIIDEVDEEQSARKQLPGVYEERKGKSLLSKATKRPKL